MFTFSLIGSYISYYFTNREAPIRLCLEYAQVQNDKYAEALRIADARKFVNTVGFCTASFGMMIMSFPFVCSDGSDVYAFLGMNVTLDALGFARGGFGVNHLDICDELHAGFVISIVNVCGTFGGVVGVPLTGWLLDKGGGTSSKEGWMLAFGLSSLFCLLGASLFCKAASGQKTLTRD